MTELEKFYQKDFHFSYSSISKLLYSPRLFYKHYILREREDTTDAHLVLGRVIHCLLLEKDQFDKQFIVSSSKLPSENIKKIIDSVYYRHYLQRNDEDLELKDFNSEILQELKNAGLHQTLKTDQQRYDKVINELNNSYFTYLKLKENKTVIDPKIYDSAVETAKIVKNNEVISTLMNLNNNLSENIRCYNEVLLTSQLIEKPYKLQGHLDNVLIDGERKMIFINDLKTTSKPIQDFSDSVEYYNYWIQAVIYYHLVIDNYLKDVDIRDWQIYFTFVVIDNYNNVYPFQVSDQTFKLWLDKFYNEILTVVDYHYTKKDYTLPYQLAVNNVKL